MGNITISDPDEIVIVRSVTKSFGDKVALAGISFDIPSGQVCGLLGRTAPARRPCSAY